MRQLLVVGLLQCAVLASVTTAAAQSPPAARVVPESVLTHDVPPSAKLILVGSPAADRDLTRATGVFVGAQKVTPTARDAASVTFTPPRADAAGEVTVEARDDKGVVLAAGTMRYVSATPVDRTWLAVFYTLLVLSFPFALMFYDLRKAYRYACETRILIMQKASADGLTSEELKLLLAELSQSPPGIPGLARNSIAFMLMMILGVAIVHILAVDPPGAKDIPASIDRILVLLTGLLTSVVSFYFGSRAAETAQHAARAAASDGAAKPAGLTFAPTSGKPGDEVKLSGAGFGSAPGTVLFGETPAEVTPGTWTDRDVTVKVPAGAKPGKVRVTLTPRGSDRKIVSSVDFEILGGAAAPIAGGGDDSVDGCNVEIKQTTPDEDLPAAEGGVER